MTSLNKEIIRAIDLLKFAQTIDDEEILKSIIASVIEILEEKENL